MTSNSSSVTQRGSPSTICAAAGTTNLPVGSPSAVRYAAQAAGFSRRTVRRLSLFDDDVAASGFGDFAEVGQVCQ